MKKPTRRSACVWVLAGLLAVTWIGGQALAAEAAKPNILVIWGDDIGQSNISTYTHGVMGYQTPNIDRVVDYNVILSVI